MGPLGCFSLVFRAALQRVADADLLDDQDLVLEIDLAFGFRRQPSPTRVDPTRLQRATQGAGESTGCGSHYVVESRRVVGILTRRSSVMLAHLVVGAESHRLRLDRQVRLADRSSLTNDSYPRNVSWLDLAHRQV